ncbi:dehydrogenase E1 and transketolase domain-containing protein 1 [Clavulina sp. PMI_390]|nr:dehydrogenase E1 and transketolase domain-containing protein 1 [Clavulina sp. PMI_390]
MLSRTRGPQLVSRTSKLQNRLPRLVQLYHDDSAFGYRRAKAYVLPDYTSAQLENRALNAPLLRYVDSVRTHGHRAATIDPLDLLQREEVAALDPTRYGLSDPKRLYNTNGILWNRSVLEKDGSDPSDHMMSLEAIVRRLRTTYVGRISFEYMHSPNKSERLWWSHFLEGEQQAFEVDSQKKQRIWSLMMRSETFDQFLQTKFPNLKRYGLEGAESMLPALDALFMSSAQVGVENIILCMPHRGRLSLLTDLLQGSPTALFHKIRGGLEMPEGLGATGDVISHLPASADLTYGSNRTHVSLLQNPSHLEAVNPVALGKTRAKQQALLKDADPDCALGDKVMCIQLHGDAAFTGQGVVMEGLGLSNLPHYTSGGSVHLVVNNNIGYTTPASSARSSLYCSDIGKMINAPVLHVNGDHPEDVVRAVDAAFSYRNHFRKDVIIDLITYRRWGHNELDEPAFTQPQMYHKIRSRKSVPVLYEDKLIAEDTITSDEASKARKSYKAFLEEQLKGVESYVPKADTLGGRWSSMVWPSSPDGLEGKDPSTGVDIAKLREIGTASVHVPIDFEVHPRLQRHIKARIQSLESGNSLDWGTAEALAFGSLITEGFDIRISGQDVGRGTFSHRHAMLVDQRTENVHVPLNALSSSHKLELANSSLSEMAVLGFELGMSWESPGLLPIWEAQFGDFHNGSQVIIDTFVASSQTKWLKQSGIVMLLPHGLDGAGPEHSSSRIERFLQLTNDSFDYHDHTIDTNIHIVNPTTPAQYFHLLRRQMKRNHRKPLIVASPKGLLRSPLSTSSIEAMGSNTRFQPIPRDERRPSPELRKILLVSGKVYYDLAKEIKDKALESEIQVIRVEELCPFPFSLLASTLRDIVDSSGVDAENIRIQWIQEEARNQGAYTYAALRMPSLFEKLGWSHNLEYAGRRPMEVPAVGAPSLHTRDKAEFLAAALQ